MVGVERGDAPPHPLWSGSPRQMAPHTWWRGGRRTHASGSFPSQLPFGLQEAGPLSPRGGDRQRRPQLKPLNSSRVAGILDTIKCGGAGGGGRVPWTRSPSSSSRRCRRLFHTAIPDRACPLTINWMVTSPKCSGCLFRISLFFAAFLVVAIYPIFFFIFSLTQKPNYFLKIFDPNIQSTFLQGSSFCWFVVLIVRQPRSGQAPD